jgi:release factor glutamine methyltransferase
LRFLVLPGAFHPRSDTWMLAAAARREPLPRGARVLELCAGPALAGVSAAMDRASLSTVDVSRRAVANAWLNGRLNRVDVSARRGDLFDAVAGERFDLILANPPYVPGDDPPASGAARAWEGGSDGRAVLDRICARAAEHLTPAGSLLLVHSELCDPGRTCEQLEAAGLRAEIVVRERGPFGPLVEARRERLQRSGLLREGQTTEEVVVVRGQAWDLDVRRAVAARTAATAA